MYIMPFKFNHELWNIGKKIEDAVLPELNKAFNCDLERTDNIFDIIDFKDNSKKIAIEVKGRRINSNQYKDTIITRGKINEGWKLTDEGWKVYLVFVFKDKTLYHELTGEESWNVKLTGTNHIEHFLIPISSLIEYDKDCEPEPEGDIPE